MAAEVGGGGGSAAAVGMGRMACRPEECAARGTQVRMLPVPVPVPIPNPQAAELTAANRLKLAPEEVGGTLDLKNRHHVRGFNAQVTRVT